MEEYKVLRGVPVAESTMSGNLGASGNGQARQASSLDYKEIFGALASCSIPVLDLPPVEDGLDFRHCSAMDYPDIFGGIDDRDFAVSYEKLFASHDSRGVRVPSSSSPDGIINRDIRQNKLQTGSSSNSHNAAATDDDKTTKRNGLDDVSGIKGKQNLVHEVSSKISSPADHGFDAFIEEFGQTASSLEDQEHVGGSSKVKSPPPQSNDQSLLRNSIEKKVNMNPQSADSEDLREKGEVTEECTVNEIITDSAEGLTFNKRSTPGSPLGSSSPSSENFRIHNQAKEFHHSRSSSTTSFSSLDRIYSDDTFLKVTDISLRTKPLKVPPPRRAPPVRPSPKFYSGEMSSYHSIKSTNIDAAASVAAMKEAMEVAQARLRSAKASLEKKRESLQNRKREIGQEKRRGKGEEEKIGVSEESGEWKVEEQFYELMAVPNLKVNEKSSGQLPDQINDVRSKESGANHSEKLETKWRASKEAFICEVGDSGVLRKPRTPKISEKPKNTLENEIMCEIDAVGEGKGEERERGNDEEATLPENQKKESGRNMQEEAERVKRKLEERERRQLEEEREKARQLQEEEEERERRRRLEEEEKREKERLRILREKEDADRRKAEEEERERRLEEEEKREKERLRIVREKEDAERRKAEEKRERRRLEEEREKAKRLHDEEEREKRRREEDKVREKEKLRMLREKEDAERRKTEEESERVRIAKEKEGERLLQEENEERERMRLQEEEEAEAREKDKLRILREKEDEERARWEFGEVEEREVSNIKLEDERGTKPEERVRGKWKIEEERMKFRKLESVIERQEKQRDQRRTEKGKEVEIDEEERERRKQEEEREREREREKDRQAAERAARETNERALAEKAAAMEKSLARLRAEKAAQEGKSATTPGLGLSEAGETAIRSRARMERHQRTVERAAKALAEKNMRDVISQREQAERNRLAESLDAEIRRWSNGKEGNLRALLSTLQYILGAESGWQPVPLTEVLTAQGVKKAYRKATLCVHPDKLQQRGASIHHKYLCEKVFDLLKEAWSRFNSEER